MRLVGRLFVEPSGSVQQMFKARFEELFVRFTSAFQRALPKLRKRDYFWRMHLHDGGNVFDLVRSGRTGLMV
ncbi:MAG: hypothetical protein M2R45_04819 [Verrucomicrobia subdivision 3 bacterium]|nr:hypothetical protein [Limisphaerales bacterium]MCS1417292.1 hypothetical protein [Limisphaerales bacterium]